MAEYYRFNVILANQRGLSEEDQECLNTLYAKLETITKRPTVYFQKPEEAVDAVRSFENVLQFMWGFHINENFHRYWKNLKGCTCPKTDNDDIAYAGRHVINMGCPYHGATPAESWEDRRFS